MKFSTVCSIGVLVAFFLPWIDISFLTTVSLSGYDIPISVNQITKILGTFFGGDKVDLNRYQLWISLFFYFIPILSIISILMGLTKSKSFWFHEKGVEFLLAFGLIVCLYYIVKIINSQPTAPNVNLGIGVYLTALFSILGIISLDIKRYWKKTKNFIENDSQTDIDLNTKLPESLISSEEKTNLLNQLSQLHDLKEKGVLTEDIYEQERQGILSKFQSENSEIKANELLPPVLEERSEQIQISGYEDPFEREPWVKRNKNYLIFFTIIIISFVGIFFLNKSTTNFKQIIVGKWEVSNLTELYGRSVEEIIYEFDNDNSYRTSEISSFLNESGRTSSNEKDTTNGKYEISEDGKVLTLFYKTQISHSGNNNINITDTLDVIDKFEILQISNDSIRLFGPKDYPSSIVFQRKK